VNLFSAGGSPSIAIEMHIGEIFDCGWALLCGAAVALNQIARAHFPAHDMVEATGWGLFFR
jgi:hypothetical protein